MKKVLVIILVVFCLLPNPKVSIAQESEKSLLNIQNSIRNPMFGALEKILDFLIHNNKVETISQTLTEISPNTKIIDTNSQTLSQILGDSAQNTGIPIAFIKAIARTEAGLMSFTEEEVQFFNSQNWWATMVWDAPRDDTRADLGRGLNDSKAIRGQAYNTCRYMDACFAGADVRGVTQFELATWNGIKGQLNFSDGHDPDRKYVRDAVMGTGVFVQGKIQKYFSQYNISPGQTDWTEEQVRAMARAYCYGTPEKGTSSAACMQGDLDYDDLVWMYYQQYSNQ